MGKAIKKIFIALILTGALILTSAIIYGGDLIREKIVSSCKFQPKEKVVSSCKPQSMKEQKR